METIQTIEIHIWLESLNLHAKHTFHTQSQIAIETICATQMLAKTKQTLIKTKMKMEIKQNETMTIDWKTQMLRFSFDYFHRHELNDFFFAFTPL